MYVISGYEGQPIHLDALQYLPDDLLLKNKAQIEKMAKAALGDYQNIVKTDKFDLDVLHAVDQFYDRPRIKSLIEKSDPEDFSNDYLVAVGEFGVMLGKLFEEREGFGWLYSHPYFRSTIVHRNTGFGIPVFDWAIKKLSEYGVDDGFAAKFEMALDGVRRREEENR
jgi:hypothetical protein